MGDVGHGGVWRGREGGGGGEGVAKGPDASDIGRDQTCFEKKPRDFDF